MHSKTFHCLRYVDVAGAVGAIWAQHIDPGTRGRCRDVEVGLLRELTNAYVKDGIVLARMACVLTKVLPRAYCHNKRVVCVTPIHGHAVLERTLDILNSEDYWENVEDDVANDVAGLLRGYAADIERTSAAVQKRPRMVEKCHKALKVRSHPLFSTAITVVRLQ